MYNHLQSSSGLILTWKIQFLYVPGSWEWSFHNWMWTIMTTCIWKKRKGYHLSHALRSRHGNECPTSPATSSSLTEPSGWTCLRRVCWVYAWMCSLRCSLGPLSFHSSSMTYSMTSVQLLTTHFLGTGADHIRTSASKTEQAELKHLCRTSS